MHLCIPIDDRPEGGLYTFLRYLRRYLDARGIAHSTELSGTYDLLLVNSFVVPAEDIRAAKERLSALRVVQRVDGSASDYGRTDNADHRQARVNLLADLTIYQSNYGRYATRKKIKVLSRDGPVIHNPVDTDLFRPDGETMELAGNRRVAYVSFSTNPKKGAGDLYRVAEDHPDVDFHLVGRYENCPGLQNLHQHGLLSSDRLSVLLRSCDALAFFSENETCSNVLLEGLATGLPVLYKDSGGNGELVGEGGSAVTVTTFREALEAVLVRRDGAGRMARERAVREFAVERILDAYLEAIGSCRRRPLPSAWDLGWACLRGYPVLPCSRRHLPAMALRWCVRRSGRGRT